MQKIGTIRDIRNIEQASDQAGYTFQDMMAAAGKQVAICAQEMVKHIAQPRITVLIGQGNNGGDGLVAALELSRSLPGADIQLYLLKDRYDDLSQKCRDAGLFIAVQAADHNQQVLTEMILSTDLLIDALFGIGARLPLSAEANHLLGTIHRILDEKRKKEYSAGFIAAYPLPATNHKHAVQVLAVDCPSGIDCDTGAVDDCTIAADETITFIAVKQGLLKFPAAEYVGRLSITDINIPDHIIRQQALQDSLLDQQTILDLLPQRSLNAHKGTYGSVLIVAGSENYPGAPSLAAEAAYRTGSGVVTIGTSREVIQAIAATNREVTWLPLLYEMESPAQQKASMVVAREASRYSSLLIGPGIGQSRNTWHMFSELLSMLSPKSSQITNTAASADRNASVPPLIIDADGLNLLGKIDQWWQFLPSGTILTPHPGEMARLTGIAPDILKRDRWEIARSKAVEWNCVVVLKGAHTVIADPDGTLSISPFKTDALATAGTGDILAGIIASLRGQGLSAREAAMAGTFIHGFAGMCAASHWNTRSIIAGDILKMIPEVFAILEG